MVLLHDNKHHTYLHPSDHVDSNSTTNIQSVTPMNWNSTTDIQSVTPMNWNSTTDIQSVTPMNWNSTTNIQSVTPMNLKSTTDIQSVTPMNWKSTTDIQSVTPMDGILSAVTNNLMPSHRHEIIMEFKCPYSDGHFPSPDGNCSEYFSCKHSKPQLAWCPRNLYFNPITQLCDHFDESYCERKCLQDGLFPVLGSCTKYMKCSNNVSTVYMCPSDMHFNAIVKHCTSPEKAGCTVKCTEYDTLLPLPGRCNLYAQCIRGKAITKMCPNDLHFNSIRKICDKPEVAHCEEKCPEYGNLFPVFGECSLHLECFHNELKVATCPTSMEYNFMTHACELPKTEQKCLHQCPQPNGFFDYPGVCTLYLKCLNSIPIVQMCPPNHIFNPLVGQCDNAVKNSCSLKCPWKNGIFPVIGHRNYFMQCTNNEAQIKECANNRFFNPVTKECQPSSKSHSVCPTPFGLFPVRGTCNFFFSCNKKEFTVHQCPDELHFNTRTLTCDQESSAHCHMICPNDNTIHPVLDGFNSYVECIRGIPSLKMCASGSSFNFETKKCDGSSKKICTIMSPQRHQSYIVPGIPNSYVDCNNEEAHFQTCPDGLFYSDTESNCDLVEHLYYKS